jgi:hypothetical protein
LVIIQSGIVDCAPRPFTRVEFKIINTVGLIRRIYNSRLKDKLKAWGKSRGYTNTSLNDFRHFAQRMDNIFPNATLYWNQIMPASDAYETSLPGIRKNINTYNMVLEEIFGTRLITYPDFPADGLMSDFHHLSVNGHKAFYEKMLCLFEKHSI